MLECKNIIIEERYLNYIDISIPINQLQYPKILFCTRLKLFIFYCYSFLEEGGGEMGTAEATS